MGIGNGMAGDDALGAWAINHFDTNQSGGVEVIDAGLSGWNLLDLMDGAKAVILVDAILSAQAPGTIHRLEIPRDLNRLKKQEWSSNLSSTHSFGLAETLILGETLGLLPSTVIVFGIEIQQATIGESPSPSTLQAMADLHVHISQEIEALTCMNSNS